MTSISSITYSSLNQSIGLVVSKRESSLKDLISGMGENVGTAEMLDMQQQVQQWSMFTQIQSTIVKELSDAMKGVIQKAA